MFIVPSFLEYSVENLNQKLYKINERHIDLLKITGQKLPTTFHLDFVLPSFARTRGVKSSLSLVETMQSLSQNWHNSAVLQIHLMGEASDFETSIDFFDSYQFNPEWQYQIFIPEQEISNWLKFESENQNVQIGFWYDLTEWEKIDVFDYGIYLLMTVPAGQSGQTLAETIKQLSLSKVRQNDDCQFVLDGGWSADFESEMYNFSVVSYSSFWKKFQI